MRVRKWVCVPFSERALTTYPHQYVYQNQLTFHSSLSNLHLPITMGLLTSLCICSLWVWFQIIAGGLPACLCFKSVGSSPPLHSHHFAQPLEQWDLSLRCHEYKISSTFYVPGAKMDASPGTLAPLVVGAPKCLPNEWTSLGSYKENAINVKLWSHCTWINGFQFWLHIRGDPSRSFLEIQILGLHSPKGCTRQLRTTVISRSSPCALIACQGGKLLVYTVMPRGSWVENSSRFGTRYTWAIIWVLHLS